MSEDRKQLDRIETLLTKLDERQDRMEIVQVKQEATLASQAKSLKEHIKRTELLEAQVEPIKAHVNKVNLLFRFTLAIGGLVIAAAEIYAALKGAL